MLNISVVWVSNVQGIGPWGSMVHTSHGKCAKHLREKQMDGILKQTRKYQQKLGTRVGHEKDEPVIYQNNKHDMQKTKLATMIIYTPKRVK